MIQALYMVELSVADWPAATAWYRDVLGLTPVLTDAARQFVLFAVGGGRLALKAGTPEPGNTLVVFEVADLDALLARLAEQQVESEGPMTSSAEGYRRAIVRDADGHRLCLFEWTR